MPWANHCISVLALRVLTSSRKTATVALVIFNIFGPSSSVNKYSAGTQPNKNKYEMLLLSNALLPKHANTRVVKHK